MAARTARVHTATRLRAVALLCATLLGTSLLTACTDPVGDGSPQSRLIGCYGSSKDHPTYRVEFVDGAYYGSQRLTSTWKRDHHPLQRPTDEQLLGMFGLQPEQVHVALISSDGRRGILLRATQAQLRLPYAYTVLHDERPVDLFPMSCTQPD